MKPINMKLPSLSLLVLFCFSLACAQDGDDIHLPALGVSVNLPEGFQYVDFGGGYVIINPDNAEVVILIVPHDQKTLDLLQADLKDGIQGSGIDFKLSESFESLGDNITGAFCEGTIEGEPSKGYVAGIVPPTGQQGIIVLMTGGSSAEHVMLTKQITKSISYDYEGGTPENEVAEPTPKVSSVPSSDKDTRPVKPSTVKETPATRKLAQEWIGVALTNSNTYYSEGDYNADTDMTDQISVRSINRIILCDQNHFIREGEGSVDAHSSSTIDENTAVNSDDYVDMEDANRSGLWKIGVNREGKQVLELRYFDGEITTYIIDFLFDGEVLWLNRQKWYRDYDHQKCK